MRSAGSSHKALEFAHAERFRFSEGQQASLLLFLVHRFLDHASDRRWSGGGVQPNS
jgi:hypothetical protein